MDVRASKDSGLKDLACRLLKWQSYYWLAFPGMVAIIWHIYVVRHFGISPAEQATVFSAIPS